MAAGNASGYREATAGAVVGAAVNNGKLPTSRAGAVRSATGAAVGFLGGFAGGAWDHYVDCNPPAQQTPIEKFNNTAKAQTAAPTFCSTGPGSASGYAVPTVGTPQHNALQIMKNGKWVRLDEW